VNPYKAASTIKLSLASLLMKGVDDCRWTFDTTVTVKPEDIVGGSGVLQKEGKRRWGLVTPTASCRRHASAWISG
jgi:beta-lactamase class A